MLAAVPHDIPLREHSHLDLQHSNQQPHNNSLVLEDRLCPGCKNSVVNEQGGLVVAFGQSFFHVDCFKCAKCRNQVTADTNLLLLSDGSPICANCSYSCNICHLPILDEAIMTGDDSYHAHCFKCKVCSNRIDELVFAKTSQGIYCMNCHNERMIKIRKHAQKKAEREKAGAGSGSSRSREQEARNFHRDQDKSAADEQARSGITRSHSNLAASARSDSSRPPDAYRSPAKPIQGPYVSDAFEANPPSYSNAPAPRPLPPTQPSRSPSVVIAPPETETKSSINNLYQHSEHLAQLIAPAKSNTLPIPPLAISLNSKRRSSYDDGVRPLNVLLKSDSLTSETANFHPNVLPNNDVPTPQGLSVTSKRDKRRSINPGISFSPLNPSNQSTTISPLQASLTAPDLNASPGAPYMNPNEPSQSASSSRPPSRTESVHSTPSLTKRPEPLRQRSRSSSIFDDSYYRESDDHDDTIVMASPPTMSVELENYAEPSQPRFSTSSKRQGRNSGGPLGQRSSATLSPTDANGFRAQQRRGSSSSNFSVDRYGANLSRATSPAYHADVPHSVESGTDTELENDDGLFSDNDEVPPPAPPPKDRNSTRSSNLSVADQTDADTSDLSQFGDMSDEVTDLQPVERMSHSTFIAPALPPIRFSMNTADFGDLLNSVGGLPSLKSLDNISKLTKEHIPSTPPPTASSFETFKQEVTPTASETRHSSHSVNSTSSLSNVPEEHHTAEQQGLTVQSQSSQNGSRPSSRAPSPIPSVVLSIPRRTDSNPDLVINRLREALNNAKEKGAPHLKIDLAFVDAVLEHVESRNAEYLQLKGKVDGMNRESKLYIDGMTVAQAEYDRELKARRDAEAEVTRLRVLLSGQAVRLTTLSGDNRRQELRQQMSKELNDSLSGLEHDLSRLKVERDLTLAEVEELSAKKSTGNITDIGPTNLGRSLTKRLENIRSQYQRELVPLNEQKEILNREISELKAVRDVFLEETTVLNARNEELAQLTAFYTRRIDNQLETPAKAPQESSDTLQPRAQPYLIAPSLSNSTSQSSMYDDTQESYRSRPSRSDNNDIMTPMKMPNKFKWPGSSSKVQKEQFMSPAMEIPAKGKAHIEHNFQQLSVLRFTRCDHCGDKMWGSQLRCSACSTSIHVRCIANVQIPCTQYQNTPREEPVQVSMGPPMFGRDLTEQVQADSKGEERQVPVIVEKCIEAVEERALDYEGIYRKTGGSGQTKAITQMFERGDYASFDLCDSDRFNDICSVTSVLKTYFRSLPVPLLTFDLHDQFMTAIMIREPSLKQQSLVDLIDKLPNEYYFTLRMLMLHLNRIRERCEKNLMNGRNLGVVFGPTLMRSRDPGAEFSDMAGKALFVEWLVDNAPLVFNTTE